MVKRPVGVVRPTAERRGLEKEGSNRIKDCLGVGRSTSFSGKRLGVKIEKWSGDSERSNGGTFEETKRKKKPRGGKRRNEGEGGNEMARRDLTSTTRDRKKKRKKHMTAFLLDSAP